MISQDKALLPGFLGPKNLSLKAGGIDTGAVLFTRRVK
jgi:hypothetical protein